MTEAEELRNQRDYRLHVLCEARRLILLLPESERRETVLEAMWKLIQTDLNITAEMLYEYRSEQKRAL